MSAPSPSLSISDIMHPLSPPPAINDNAGSPPPRPKSSTPELSEPLELAEIEGMRKRVMSMGYGNPPKGKEKVTSREQELADMLLKLTHPASLPQPSQLHAQAETIASLIRQRDFLVERSAEERELWEAEREGWARAAQALLMHGRKEKVQSENGDMGTSAHHTIASEASFQRHQEIERINALFHSEKKILQQKLNETQSRLKALESELVRLKPLLLFQPGQSHTARSGLGSSTSLPNIGPSTPRHGVKRWNEASDHEPDSDDETSRLKPRPQFRNPVLRPVGAEPAFPTLQPSFPQSPQKPKGRRDVFSSAVPSASAQTPKTPRKKAGHVQTVTSSKPLLSDARTEHLLLAARKLGMRRATYLSGIYAQSYSPPDPPTPRKQRRTASPSKPQPTPKTPRRTGNASTPLLTRTPLDTSSVQPRTPLQSLLSVAQSVLSDSGTHSLAPPESPLAKRRKIEHRPSNLLKEPETPPPKYKGKEKQDSAETPHFKSALDFLADQAEVYGSKSGSRERDEQPSATTQGDVEMEDASGSTDHDISDLYGQTEQDKSGHNSRAASEHPTDNNLAETQETGIGNYSQDENLSFIQELPSPPSTLLANPEPKAQSKSPEDPNNLTTDSLTLAPAIDLTPRASRSPGPRDHQRRSHHNSRSRSADDDNGSGSFVMFSLNRLQPPGSPGTSGVTEGSSVMLTSRIDSVKFIAEEQPRRTRSPYTKWTKEEDELLVKAVAKHGQKWDLVRKELPSRGYHQVRQRWLRRSGDFDNITGDPSERNTIGDLTVASVEVENDNEQLDASPTNE